ncbi:MAG: hypothetical protein WDN46_10210 [Methylocella sp.]
MSNSRRSIFNTPKKYETALAAKKKSDADFKNVCKAATADLGKRAVDNIKLGLELKTPEGEARLKEAMASQIMVARWSGLPVGHMDDMFPTDRTPINERTRADGKRAGLAGESCNPPRHLTGTLISEWTAGHAEGQAVNLSAIRQKPAEDDDADLRPGFMRRDDPLADVDQAQGDFH